MPVLHAFVNSHGDGTDATLTRPSNWNAAHTIQDVIPTALDATYDLGSAALRWRDIYASSALRLGAAPATAGAVRLANNTYIYVRNAANTGDKLLAGMNSLDGVLIDNAGQGVSFGPTGAVIITDSGSGAISIGTSPATSAALRLANTGGMSARNATNTGDLALVNLDSSNVVQIGSGGAFTVVNGGFGKALTISTNSTLTSDGLQVGAFPSASGSLMVPNNTELKSRNAANTADLSLIGAGGADNVFVASSSAVGLHLFYGANGWVDMGVNPATSGTLRMPNNQAIAYRNAANTGDFNCFLLTNADQIQVFDSRTAANKILRTKVADGTGHMAASEVYWSTA